MKWLRKLVFKNFGKILSIVLSKNNGKTKFFLEYYCLVQTQSLGNV